VAIATVILPNLSRHHASDSSRAYSETLDWALRMILIIAVPAAAALILLAEPILMTLFYYGEVMTVKDITMATFSLRAYAAGLVAFMLIKVLAPGFFARQDMRTPVRIGIIAMVANMVLNLLLVIPLHSYWQLGHVGLATATSLSAFLNALLLLVSLRRGAIYQPSAQWVRFSLMLLCSVTVMVAVLLWTLGQVGSDQLWQLGTWWQRVLRITLLCGAGFASYLVCLLASGFRLADLRGPSKATNRFN
jgi:putative peptidoglycan lipid II flippase